MVMLVHIAPLKLAPKIRRSGLRPDEGLFGGYKSRILYCFPVLESYTLSHQWTREIMKWRRQPLVGVYFRVPNDESVEFAKFNAPARRLPAAAAVGEIRKADDPRGFEIMLNRPVEAKEIHRIAPIRGVVGWRHKPDANGQRPCGCPGCIARGEPGGRRLRERYDRGDL